MNSAGRESVVVSVGRPPHGMSGARTVGHLLIDGRRRKARWGVVALGAEALFEIF